MNFLVVDFLGDGFLNVIFLMVSFGCRWKPLAPMKLFQVVFPSMATFIHHFGGLHCLGRRR